jgi:deoxycytidylate deaminase
MNCPNCKNPISDNAAVCEWCGTQCTNQHNVQGTKGNITSDLDAELIAILKAECSLRQLKKARDLYRIRTRSDLKVSNHYINTLVRRIYSVEEYKKVKEEGQDEYNEKGKERNRKAIKRLFNFWGIIHIIGIIYFMIYIISNK